MNVPPLRIATRASQLALWQARHVAELITTLEPAVQVELLELSTVGDRDQSAALVEFGGVGVFTREVQRAVLDGRADLAVHSLKDLPTDSTPGLALGGVPARGSVADVLVLPRAAENAARDPQDVLQLLPNAARVGTGSLRRRAQLLHARPDLRMLDVRGNVETRIRKLDDGQYDALVLAAAGLERLGLQQRISAVLGPPLLLHAVGQGALGLECRESDQATRDLLARLSDPPTLAAITAERQVLAQLRAGCHAPVGVETAVRGETLRIQAVVLSPDGSQRREAECQGPLGDAARLGSELAQELIALGADSLIAQAEQGI